MSWKWPPLTAHPFRPFPLPVDIGRDRETRVRKIRNEVIRDRIRKISMDRT